MLIKEETFLISDYPTNEDIFYELKLTDISKYDEEGNLYEFLIEFEDLPGYRKEWIDYVDNGDYLDVYTSFVQNTKFVNIELNKYFGPKPEFEHIMSVAQQQAEMIP